MPLKPKQHRPRGIKAHRPPAPARGKTAERGYGGAWQAIRQRVLIRDCYTCQSCHSTVGIRPKDAHVDHVISLASGGTNDESNLRTLCATCHSRKTASQDGAFGNRKSV